MVLRPQFHQNASRHKPPSQQNMAGFNDHCKYFTLSRGRTLDVRIWRLKAVPALNRIRPVYSKNRTLTNLVDGTGLLFIFRRMSVSAMRRSSWKLLHVEWSRISTSWYLWRGRVLQRYWWYLHMHKYDRLVTHYLKKLYLFVWRRGNVTGIIWLHNKCLPVYSSKWLEL